MQALRMVLFMTLLTGLIYPLSVTGLGQMFFSEQANGSLIRDGNTLIGSSLIAQKVTRPKYFWPRPSAVDFNPLPSGGSNFGATSADFQKIVNERRQQLKAVHEKAGEPPPDLLFASGSGLDPHISPAAARYQIARVALARHVDPSRVEKLVEQTMEGRQFGVFGEPRVNVLRLNLALDRELPQETSP